MALPAASELVPGIGQERAVAYRYPKPGRP